MPDVTHCDKNISVSLFFIDIGNNQSRRPANVNCEGNNAMLNSEQKLRSTVSLKTRTDKTSS